MAFTDHEVSSYTVPRGKRIQGLLDRLPDDEAEALMDLVKSENVPVVRVHEIILAEAENFPDIDPQWFDVAHETVRKFCKAHRPAQTTQVRGL